MPVARGVARVAVRLEHRDRRVRIEVVDNLHAPVVDVVEDVGERQRRREEHDRVCCHDRRDHPARAQQRHVAQADQVAREHQHDRGCEQPPQARGAARQRRPQAAERSRHPVREVMARGRGRKEAGTVGCRHYDQQAACQDRDQDAYPDRRLDTSASRLAVHNVGGAPQGPEDMLATALGVSRHGQVSPTGSALKSVSGSRWS